MTNETIPINPTTQIKLLELAARTGRPVGELLDRAVEEFRQRLEMVVPIKEVPGVDPAEMWEAAAQAAAGNLTPHSDVFAKLRK